MKHFYYVKYPNGYLVFCDTVFEISCLFNDHFRMPSSWGRTETLSKGEWHRNVVHFNDRASSPVWG